MGKWFKKFNNSPFPIIGLVMFCFIIAGIVSEALWIREDLSKSKETVSIGMTGQSNTGPDYNVYYGGYVECIDNLLSRMDTSNFGAEQVWIYHYCEYENYLYKNILNELIDSKGYVNFYSKNDIIWINEWDSYLLGMYLEEGEFNRLKMQYIKDFRTNPDLDYIKNPLLELYK